MTKSQSQIEKANKDLAELSSTVDAFETRMRNAVPMPMNVDASMNSQPKSHMRAIRSGLHVPANWESNSASDVAMTDIDNEGPT